MLNLSPQEYEIQVLLIIKDCPTYSRDSVIKHIRYAIELTDDHVPYDDDFEKLDEIPQAYFDEIVKLAIKDCPICRRESVAASIDFAIESSTRH